MVISNDFIETNVKKRAKTLLSPNDTDILLNTIRYIILHDGVDNLTVREIFKRNHGTLESASVYQIILGIRNAIMVYGNTWIRIKPSGSVFEPYEIMRADNAPDGNWIGPFHCPDCAEMCASFGLTEVDSYKWNHGNKEEISYVFMREQ